MNYSRKNDKKCWSWIKNKNGFVAIKTVKQHKSKDSTCIGIFLICSHLILITFSVVKFE